MTFTYVRTNHRKCRNCFFREIILLEESFSIFDCIVKRLYYLWCQNNFCFVRVSSVHLPNSKNVFYYFLVITTGVPRRVSRLRDSCHNNYMMMLIYAFMFFILLEISILSAFTENVQARSRKKCHCTPICKKVIESIVYLEKRSYLVSQS